MRIIQEYTTHDTVRLIEVDTSCTSQGVTITTRRNRHHEGTVLAARVSYLENLEARETHQS